MVAGRPMLQIQLKGVFQGSIRDRPGTFRTPPWPPRETTPPVLGQVKGVTCPLRAMTGNNYGSDGRTGRNQTHVTAQDTGAMSANVHDDIARNTGNNGTFEDTNTFTINPDATSDIGANGVSQGIMAAVTELDRANDVKGHKHDAHKQGQHGDTLERDQVEYQDLSMMEKALMPRIVWEKVEGDTEEYKHLRKKAIEVAKAKWTAERAKNCREDVAEMFRDRVPLTPEAKAELEAEVEDRINSPVWDRLTQDEIAEINQCAKSMDEMLPERCPSRSKIALRIAARYDAANARFSDILKVASEEVLNSIQGEYDIRQKIGDIDEFEEEQATVEGWVKCLFRPNQAKQEQVGYLTDESGVDAKVVKWKKSQKKTHLTVGARVRLENVEVDYNYNENQGEWEMTLAITSDSAIEVLSEGQGRSTRSPRSKPSSSHRTWARCNSRDSKIHQREINRELKEEAQQEASLDFDL